MPDYERTTTVDAGRDDVFEYLSTLDNLPRYMARMTGARSLGGDEVEVSAVVEDESGGAPHEVVGEAWFRVDADARTIAWGAPGPHDYSGDLSVAGDQARSEVTVHLHTEHVLGSEQIEAGMDETLDSVRRLVESNRPR